MPPRTRSARSKPQPPATPKKSTSRNRKPIVNNAIVLISSKPTLRTRGSAHSTTEPTTTTDVVPNEDGRAGAVEEPVPTPAKKPRALNDITEAYLAATSTPAISPAKPMKLKPPPSPTHDRAHLRARRRPRAPLRPIPTRVAPELTKVPEPKMAYPSSLPPSSPPPTSSQQANFDLAFNTSQDGLIRGRKSLENEMDAEEEEEEVRRVMEMDFETGTGYDIGAFGEGSDGGKENGDDEDDPFGLLAAERKIRERREAAAREAKGKGRAVSPVRSELEYADVPMDDMYNRGNDKENAPTYEDKENQQQLMRIATPLPTPDAALRPIPRKRRRVADLKDAKKGTLLQRGPSSPGSSSMPSSPSPIKPTRKRIEETTAPADAEEITSPSSAEEPEEPMPKRGKTAGPRRMRGLRGSGNPKDLARSLEALLPRRPAKRRGRIVVGEKPTRPSRKGKARATQDVTESEDDSEEDVSPKKKARATKGRAKSKPKPKAAAPESDDDDDAKEKWERERQARLDYFKKLQDYSVEKEDVYVI
ncbi:hypothetical protein PLICRDRAFT_170213 [Plicaturopsis crispa FD-325 SS-3]|nr:hypothetical protein PLICRDRAFT_170213 [Plicaturopsis crispa FD-325 SS-3]